MPETRDQQPEAVVDGRTARSLRTREAIVDACISLVDEGDLRPTGPRIAERANVSVRSVFQHFDDLENLFAMVAERTVARVAQIVVPIDASLPFEERLARFIRQRQQLLEAITPIRRAASVHAPGSAEITSRLQGGHDFLRAEVARVFATELAVGDEVERYLALDLLDTALSWPTWESLRTFNHRTPEQAAIAVERMVRLALGRV
jgi:AcrR family transcriptional regulator